MAWSYQDCRFEYSKRRKGNGFKRVKWNVKLEYDARRDCYLWRHHDTVTVEIHKDKYVINRHGWDTSTTHRLIDEATNIRIHQRAPDALAQPGWWAQNHPFEDGDEFSIYGDPLVKRPYKVRKIKVEARRKWAKLRKEFMARVQESRIMARVLIGEFDPKEEDTWVKTGRRIGVEPPTEHECLAAMMSPLMVEEAVRVLLTPRPQQSFGRIRTWVEDTPVRPPLQRLQSALGTARRAFYKEVGAYYYAYPEKQHGR